MYQLGKPLLGAHALPQAIGSSTYSSLHPVALSSRCPSSTMLDLITMISTMGVQQELQERKHVAISDAEGEEATLVEQAAASLSSALESFEGAITEIFAATEEPTPVATKQVD